MKSSILIAAMALLALASMPAQAHKIVVYDDPYWNYVPPAGEVSTPPPAPQAEMPPPPPGETMEWIPGHWKLKDGAWKWEPGHYVERPGPGASWVPGHWIERSWGWTWVPGHWI